MKKTFYWFVTAAVMVAALVSCSREELEIPTPATPVTTPATPTSQTYHFELMDGETRASLEEEGVFWQAGDKVGLFLGNNHGEADVNTNASPKTVSFTTPEPVAPDTYAYAYYPYGELNTDATSVKVVFPAQQKGSSLSAMPMAGIPFKVTNSGSTNGQIRFLNLGAVIDFRVFSTNEAFVGERIQSITFTATAGAYPVSGEATVNLAGVDPENEASLNLTWSGNVSNSSSVILKQAADVVASKDAAIAAGPMYMVVAPGAYSGTITINTNAATYTFTLTNKELSRNAIKGYNMNLANATRERKAAYVKVNSASELVDGGEYLIVYESGSKAFKPILNGSTLKASSDNCFSVEINDGRILSTDAVDECKVVLEASNSKYYMKVAALGYYFYPSRSGVSATTNKSSATACTINVSSGTIQAGSNGYFKYSTNSSYFKASSSSGAVAFYRLTEGQPTTQQLQFSKTSYAYSLDGQTPPVVMTEAPTLSGDITYVTYTSNDTSVATVDASGTVTVMGLGTTVITATAEESDGYPGSTASYTLTVYPIPTYSVENDMVEAYLDYVETHPYGPVYPDDYSTSWVTQFSSGTGENNRLDWPKPVPVSWTNPTSGNTSKTVVIYNDANHTDKEMEVSVSSSSTSAEVYSLIPGRTYWYVVNNGTTTIASGSFATIGRRRMIKVGESHYGQDYANNCRDFGGLVTVDGRTVRYGKIFRGSNMDKTPNNNDQYKEKAYLLDYMKIGLDVDLRESSGSNPLGLPYVSDKNYNSISDLTNTENMKVTIGDILDAVANNKNVYIHCKVGADRTGYVCMLLEALLGVRQDLCDTDYEMTSFSGAVGTRRRNDTSQSYYYYPRGIEFIYNQQPTSGTFQEKAEYYVQETLKISQTRIEAFRNAMLE